MVLFVDTVAVVGAGTMGAQIAEVFAMNGKNVLLHDSVKPALESAPQRIRASLDGLAVFQENKADLEMERLERDLGVRLTADQAAEVRKRLKPSFDKARAQAALSRLKFVPSLEGLASANLVVEAIVEKPEAKNDLFGRLNKLLDRRAVFCTNTSALPITPMAEASGRPDRFLGTHFFNPPTALPLVEIIAGAKTSEEAVSDVTNLLSTMRNHRYPLMPIPVKECPGFLVNRILGAMLAEAYRCLEERVASARDIDNAMKAGAGFPMGPLELSDLIGLDVIHHVSENAKKMASSYTMVDEPTVVANMVAEGRLGRKAGRGFFEYA